MKTVLAVALLGSVAAGSTLKAQEEKTSVGFTVQGDLVSSYIWRGMYQTGASMQPTFGVSVAGLSLTAWGSTDFDGAKSSEGLAGKEIDLTLAYAFGMSGLTLSVADLWWAGRGAGDYFHFKSHETSHHFEAGLVYTLPFGKVPLSVAWYTMFAGQDKDGKGKQGYSSYLELNYPFQAGRVNLNATCGMVPYRSLLYLADGFAVTNVALKGTTDIRITHSFILPIFAQAIWNPGLEDAQLVFGCTFKPGR